MLARFTEKRGLVEEFVLLHNCGFVRYREQLRTVCVWYWKVRERFVDILFVSVCACACSCVCVCVCVCGRARTSLMALMKVKLSV